MAPHILDKSVVIQVGAFDGEANDPLARILSTGHFTSAVLIEPQSRPAQALRMRYDGKASIHVLEAAIADKDGPVTLFSATDADQRASIDAGHLVNRFGIQKNQHIARTVEGITVDTVLRRFGIDEIHLLQIDCEGYDLVILSRFLARTHPALVHFEHFHLPQLDRQAAREMLNDDYYFWESAMDTFAVSKKFLDSVYV